MLTALCRYAFPLVILYVFLCLLVAGMLGSEFGVQRLFIGEWQQHKISLIDSFLHPINRACTLFNVLLVLAFVFASVRTAITSTRHTFSRWDYIYIALLSQLPVASVLAGLYTRWPGELHKFVWVMGIACGYSLVFPLLLIATVNVSWFPLLRGWRRLAEGWRVRALLLTPRLVVSAGCALLVIVFTASSPVLHFTAIMHVSLALALAYMTFAIWPTLPKIAFAGVASVVMLWGLSDPFKYQFPGLADINGASYYKSPVPLGALSDNSPSDLIDPIKGLESWKSHHPSSHKPTLVVLAASGGGYRATYWTLTVLDHLLGPDSDLAEVGFGTKNFKLLTGASGGMVGASYFAVATLKGYGRSASQAEHSASTQKALPGVRSVIDDDLQKAQAARFAAANDQEFVLRDSLSPILSSLMGDIARTFQHGPFASNRGQSLESDWERLQVTFKDYGIAESKGLAPSLIFSPILVESGSPLLVSNLDLAEFQKDSAHDMTGIYPIELFRLLPHSQNTFTLATASRMSASFPVISPAIRLPTKPPLTVYDAGFFDNYGLTAALSFLNMDRVAAWLKEHAAGAVILEVRAYPLFGNERGPSTATTQDACAVSSSPPAEGKVKDVFARGLTELGRPLDAVEGARRGAMLIRNSQFLRHVENRYPPGFVKTVVFENAGTAGLSWVIGQEEIDCMSSGRALEELRRGRNQIKQYFRKLRIDHG